MLLAFVLWKEANPDDGVTGWKNVPLQIIGSWILMFSIRAEWTHIARRLMYEPVPNHLILSLEALAALRSRTACNRAVVWAIRRVNVCM